MKLKDVTGFLESYDGDDIRIMEICGTHTSAIFKGGIRTIISPKIKLISGPGCPVCVTPAAYIDRCIELGMREDHVVLSFGDMLKVPGQNMSLADAKGEGCNVEMIYSPLEALEKAARDRDRVYVVAAVGFETITPMYGLLVEEAIERDIHNIKLLTALKTIVPPLEHICSEGGKPHIDGFLCPGHVSVITGSNIYMDLAQRYSKPFVVAGFESEHILGAIYAIVKQVLKGQSKVENLYREVVSPEGNQRASAVTMEYFAAGRASWRGLGSMDDSGMYLKDEYKEFDAGSFGLDSEGKMPPGCGCEKVITGGIDPNQCHLFGNVCTPMDPQGPCMVSEEGACGIWYRNII